MGLFINHDDHPGVFKNDSSIAEPNQRYYHQDTFSDMVSEQKAINETLSNAFYELKTLKHKEQQENLKKWETIVNKLQHILEQDDTLRKDAAERVETLSAENEAIVKRLTAYEASNQAVILQVNKLSEANERMLQALAERERVQDDMRSRLDNQEALMEKVHRQLSEFRAILYERSGYLAEKIEDSYHLTYLYVYKLFNGTDLPLTWYVEQRKTGSDSQED
ncbi:hypothetical protein GCM10028778_00500 [Barrientosiimonas marina]|uniref:Uncharacterized protein n=1 Tax=Lentibacillus kimchii TaxID=1542911 RepID=A0ABW2URH2_9BACI